MPSDNWFLLYSLFPYLALRPISSVQVSVPNSFGNVVLHFYIFAVVEVGTGLATLCFGYFIKAQSGKFYLQVDAL